MPKTSLLGNSLIWFGAAVSIAEILTGTILSPMGFWKAAAAILIGHAVGCFLLYCAGQIGAEYGVTAMESVKRSFGSKGGFLFAILNLIQLVGWSAVMIAAAAQSAHGIWALPEWSWSCIIGLLIALWIILKTRELKFMNLLAGAMLFILSIIISIAAYRDGTPVSSVKGPVLSFGDALELSIAMPLSWLPLIADYTCNATKPKLANLLSAVVYFLASCWMYFIGLTAALFAGEINICLILSKAGLGIPALLVVIFSTVTTTYLDVYSSEMSLQSITKKVPPRITGITVCILGVLIAVFCSTNSFEHFLYWIGSVFAPMIAIQIADFFVLKKHDDSNRNFQISSLVIWGIGFILYRIMLSFNPICGSTVPVMLFTLLMRVGYEKIYERKIGAIK